MAFAGYTQVMLGTSNPTGAADPGCSLFLNLVTGTLWAYYGGWTQISGAGAASPDFTAPVVPTGAVDGVNAAFVLPRVDRGVLLFADGVMQRQGTDYNLAGATATFVVAPAAGVRLDAYV